jgi:predicted DNA-binding protein
MPDKKTYGTTKDGKPITEELIEEYVAEAERGYDLDQLKVVRGRPPMGSAPAKSFPVRLDPELRAALDERADSDGRPASEIIREALRQYLDAS